MKIIAALIATTLFVACVNAEETILVCDDATNKCRPVDVTVPVNGGNTELSHGVKFGGEGVGPTGGSGGVGTSLSPGIKFEGEGEDINIPDPKGSPADRGHIEH